MFALCGLHPHHSLSQVCSFTALTALRTRLQALCLSQGSVQIPSQWGFLDSTQAGTLFFAGLREWERIALTWFLVSLDKY